MFEFSLFDDLSGPSKFVSLAHSPCHGTSAGFAISYAGAWGREVSEVGGGILFKAGLGNSRKMTYLCVDATQFDPAVMADRIICKDALRVDKSAFSTLIRKEYILHSLVGLTKLSAKHRYNESTLPVKEMVKAGYSLCLAKQEDLPAIIMLWEEWCKYKLKDPKTHIITFTGARYRRCVEDALLEKYKNVCYILKNQEGQVLSCRVLNVQEQRAFDLAFFSSLNHSFASRAMQFLSLSTMFNSSIQEVNFGESTSSGLTYFKSRFSPEILKIHQYDKKVK